MKLPRDLLSGNYCKPRLFLCETDKTRICQLDTTNTKGSFKFNSYSELSFEVARVYNDMLSGETKVNPFYDKIEALRLIELEGFGYFEIQGPDLSGDGIKEVKNIKSYSYEYTLSQKYIEDFKINMGTVDSLEVLNAEDPKKIKPITLYNSQCPELSLLHLAIEKAYGWTIGHVDISLATLSRQFEIDRQSIYDFLMTEVCEKFNCYIVFDTINSKINVYAESLTSKFIGDGNTNEFIISPPFGQVGTVSVDGYKTTRWDYNTSTGTLILDEAPADGAHIEVIDGALTEWETDVFVTFQNLAKEVNVNYDADSIKTVLTVTYGEDLNIRETNMGIPYLTDLSYYYTVDWMGQDLYDAYTEYLKKCNDQQGEYTQNTQNMLELSHDIDFEKNRLSLGFVVASVDKDTVGTYYVYSGSKPNGPHEEVTLPDNYQTNPIYFSEVSLPDEYKVDTTYYHISGSNLQDTDDGNVHSLYEALQDYFYNYFLLQKTSDKDILYSTYQKGVSDAKEEIEGLSSSFKFMEHYGYPIEQLAGKLPQEEEILGFLKLMWNEIGQTPLESLYLEQYKKIQTTNIDAGWSNKDDENYGRYYPVTIFLESIEDAIAFRKNIIDNYQEQYDALQEKNRTIGDSLLLDNAFTPEQRIRLSAFLREDELHIDDIIETSQTSTEESFALKQDAMEAGRIELQKLSQPQLQFSMSMANIYALPEFESIVDQFQLGNVIKVGLRSDYIKQSRLLQVDIGFDDLSDFSCEFGELTSLRSQSDIHADLLKKAVQAGKSVVTNASYWTRGSDQATKTDLKIQRGLLDAVESLKSMDGTQAAFMDKYGIHLERIDQVTGEKDPEKVWLVNNKIVFTDDNFKTSRMALGKVKVDGHEYYGIISEIMLAGYIEGSKIVGCDINIGNGAFVVNGQTGEVVMNNPGTINGYAKTGYVDAIQDNLTNEIKQINSTKMRRVEVYTHDSLIFRDEGQKATLYCKIYEWDTDVTDTYKSKILWKRKSADTASDASWYDKNTDRAIGKDTLTITRADVDFNASFYCEVEFDDPKT